MGAARGSARASSGARRAGRCAACGAPAQLAALDDLSGESRRSRLRHAGRGARESAGARELHRPSDRVAAGDARRREARCSRQHQPADQRRAPRRSARKRRCGRRAGDASARARADGLKAPAMAVLAEAEPHSRIDPAVREAARLLAAGDAETALGRLVPFLSDDPPLAAPRFVLAMAAWRMGRLDWAIDILRYCHERWPMDRDVAEALASLHAQSGNLVDSLYMGKLGTALGAAGPLAEFVPEGFPPFELAIAGIRERPLLEAAKIALDAGELDAAIAKASQHVALDRADGEAASFLAAALLRAGRAAEAADAMAAAAPLAERSAPIASLTARSLAAVGDAAAARRWHDRATALAPDDVAIAAARAADAIWLEHDPAAAVQAWLRRFCPPRKPPRRRAADARLVIIYLVPALADRGDAAAVAAVARAHDRGRVKVIGYGSGARSWPENAALAGAFDEWRDIAALDAATIARSIGRDGADLVVDLAGLRAPQSLIALAALEDAVCVGWLGHGVALEASPYDAAVSAASADPVAGRW